MPRSEKEAIDVVHVHFREGAALWGTRYPDARRAVAGLMAKRAMPVAVS